MEHFPSYPDAAWIRYQAQHAAIGHVAHGPITYALFRYQGVWYAVPEHRDIMFDLRLLPFDVLVRAQVMIDEYLEESRCLAPE